MTDIRQRIAYNDLDNPQSGYLIWHYGSQFTICDEQMCEIDAFNVYRADGITEEMAYNIATNHFKKVKLSHNVVNW